jgi:hypothetical protein
MTRMIPYNSWMETYECGKLSSDFHTYGMEDGLKSENMWT